MTKAQKNGVDFQDLDNKQTPENMQEKFQGRVVVSPESEPQVERVERSTITGEKEKTSTFDQNTQTSHRRPSKALPRQALIKREKIKQIESILAEGLEDIYLSMDSRSQRIFKETGEKVAEQIYSLLHQAKVKVQKIFELIKNWLRLIPGVNKWFVVQEAKLRTDKILRLAR